jgi:hypothetical protein
MMGRYRPRPLSRLRHRPSLVFVYIEEQAMPKATKKQDPSAHREDCPNCELLRHQLRELREERDAALLLVAKERERVNAIMMSQVAPVTPLPKPIRYWAVDLLNSGIKKALPLPHAGMRAAARFLQRLRKEEP